MSVPRPDFRERAVAVVVEQQARRWFEHARNAVKVPAQLVVAAREVLLRSVIDETACEQVQPPVVVIIEPDGAGGPVALERLGAQTGFLAHVGERAVAVIAIQNRPSVGGDEHIWETVVVVVANRNAHPECAAATPAFSVTSVNVPSRLFLYSALRTGFAGL
jgi:hypothetical protein